VLKADRTPAANYQISEYIQAWTDAETACKAVCFTGRLEFAMEGERYFNLVRWGIAALITNAYLAKEKNMRTYLNNAQFIKGTHDYYPIPWSEIINTNVDGKDVFVQNPGYN
jgi:hypothetical protein